jgi:exodeoxyribonuclease VII small subunit
MEPQPSFETTLRQLERIVDDLERGEPGLSEALAAYEQGVRLLAQCQEVLDKAERSIALLTGIDRQGNPVNAPFDASTPSLPESDARKVASTPASRRKRRSEKASDEDDRLIPF